MKFTLCFIFTSDLQKVLLLYKNKGPYPNSYNGVGGKIESSDPTPYYAALREIEEEVNLKLSDFTSMEFLMKIEFSSKNELNVYYAVMNDNANPKQMEDETMVKTDVNYILKYATAHSIKYAGEGSLPFFINAALLQINENGINTINSKCNPQNKTASPSAIFYE